MAEQPISPIASEGQKPLERSRKINPIDAADKTVGSLRNRVALKLPKVALFAIAGGLSLMAVACGSSPETSIPQSNKDSSTKGPKIEIEVQGELPSREEIAAFTGKKAEEIGQAVDQARPGIEKTVGETANAVGQAAGEVVGQAPVIGGQLKDTAGNATSTAQQKIGEISQDLSQRAQKSEPEMAKAKNSLGDSLGSFIKGVGKFFGGSGK